MIVRSTVKESTGYTLLVNERRDIAELSEAQALIIRGRQGMILRLKFKWLKVSMVIGFEEEHCAGFKFYA